MEKKQKVQIKETADTVYAGKVGTLTYQPEECCGENEITWGFTPDDNPGVICYELLEEEYIFL